MTKPTYIQRARGRWMAHEDRVFAYVDAYVDGCWLWMGPMTDNGYGRVMRDRRALMAHRAVWEINNGPIPDGLVIDHLCRNRRCVNPEHLEPVEQGTNMKRGEAPTAIAIRTGYCKRGHARTPENLYRAPGSPNMAHCRECLRIRHREFRARRRVQRLVA